jgi:hypothetical protein
VNAAQAWRPPVAHRMFPGDVEVFAERGEHCDERGCREPCTIHTLRRYRHKGDVFVAERFYCDEHGSQFAQRYGVEVGPAPDESGMR